jgi:hypothetical protein
MKRGGLVTGPDAGNVQFFLADNRLGAFEPLSGWVPHVPFHASTSARDLVLSGATIAVTRSNAISENGRTQEATTSSR